MRPYIIVPVDWIEKEIATYGERILEFKDTDYYTAKIMLLYKMLEEFKLINENHNTKKERDKAL